LRRQRAGRLGDRGDRGRSRGERRRPPRCRRPGPRLGLAGLRPPGRRRAGGPRCQPEPARHRGRDRSAVADLAAQLDVGQGRAGRARRRHEVNKALFTSLGGRPMLWAADQGGAGHGMIALRGRPVRRWGAVAALAAVVTAAAGCSSHLSTAELEASNRSAALEIVRSARPGTPDGGAVGPAGAGATAESGGAAPASPGGSAAVPEGPAAGGSSGTGAAVALRAGGTTAPVTGAAGSGGAGAGPAGRATSGARNGAGPNGGGPNGAGANGAGANGAGPNGGGANGAGPGGTAGALPGGGVAGAAPREVVLVSVGTGSGPIGANVASIPVAVRAWAATVNGRGGLAGHPVRVVFGDDGGDPGKALSLARRMVEEDKIVAFTGLYGPTTIRPVISYATDRGVPIVGGPSADPDEDSSPIVYNPQAG